jgi:hypothetical protein
LLVLGRGVASTCHSMDVLYKVLIRTGNPLNQCTNSGS